jgi:lysozyme family protein
MSPISLDTALRDEYGRLFATCAIRPQRLAAVDAMVTKALAGRTKYEKLQQSLGVPWFFTAVVHGLEGNFRFDTHLHNGNPLTARTVTDPKGRPASGTPPFTWEVSARDALRLKALHTWKDWSIAGMLYRLEGFNGFGYRLYHPTVLSPYLWSFSTHYVKGKYVRDSVWDPNLVSLQCGAAVMLRRMSERGIISFRDDAVSQLPLLIKGAKGESVQRLQGLLRAAFPELKDDDLMPLGDFGPITDGLVRRFQGEQQLTADGEVGPRTWSALLGVAAPS